MTEKNIYSSIFKSGIGDCPEYETLTDFVLGKEISNNTQRHINLCVTCTDIVRSIKQDENLLEEEPKEINETHLFDTLIEKDISELTTNEFNFVFNHIVEIGALPAAFGISELKKLDTLEFKKEVIALYKKSKK